jgi:serine/threonine-protein kinase
MSELSTFLLHLRRSKLLSPAEIARLREQGKANPNTDPQVVARQLLQQGKLTRFQANKLLAGVHRGLVLGPYEVLAPLGRGGMARVFLVRDRHTRHLLALKLLTPNDVKDKPKLLERLQRELHVNRRLDHPCIAQVYDLSKWHRVYCVSMEFVPGLDLGHHVKRHGAMPLDHACNLMADIALALDHTHRQGLIHADVKPGNVMVLPAEYQGRGPCGWGKLLDFGLTVDTLRPELNQHVNGKTVFGTMLFAAPEQTKPGKPIGPPADLYALGGTLFFALTGRPAFKGKTARERIHQQRHVAPPPIQSFRPSIPTPLADLVAHLLAKKPSHRPPSAAYVAEQLRNLAVICAAAPPPELARDGPPTGTAASGGR